MGSVRKSVAFVLGLTVGAGPVLVGCQSGANQPASHEMAADAVQCDQCKTVWVQRPLEAGKRRIIGYSTTKQMVCPDCRDAVSNFFATGKLRHECKACGGNMSICEAH